MKSPGTEGTPPLDVSIEELKAWLERARQEPLREDGYQKLLAAIRTLHYVTELLEKKETTLAALRELLCPASTEKNSTGPNRVSPVVSMRCLCVPPPSTPPRRTGSILAVLRSVAGFASKGQACPGKSSS